MRKFPSACFCRGEPAFYQNLNDQERTISKMKTDTEKTADKRDQSVRRRENTAPERGLIVSFSIHRLEPTEIDEWRDMNDTVKK